MHTWLLDPPAGSNSTFNLCTQFSLIYFYAQVGFCTRTWFLKNWVSFNDTFSADSKENNTLTVVWTGEGNGNPFQYSCLGNSRDRVAWWAAIYGVTQSRTWLKQLSSSNSIQFSSVQFSHSVVSYSLQLHEPQHARPPCPSPTSGVHPNTCPLSRWCHPTTSSSIVPFFSYPQSLPVSGSFPVSQLFAWSGQSIGVSALVVSPSNEHPGLNSFRMDWLDLLAVQGTLKSLLQHHSSKASILWHSVLFTVQFSHPHMTTRRTTALTTRTFVGKVMSLLFNMLSRLVITFLPRRKRLSMSWLQSPSAVILEPPKNKVSHCFHCFPIYFPWSDGTR